MLTRFSVSHYRGFKDSVTLDLSHPRDYTFNTGYIESGVIKNSLVIGPNASGKTNLLKAIADVRLNYYSPRTDYVLRGPDAGFINADSATSEAEFEYGLLFDGVNVSYSYTKDARQHLTHERLSFDNTCVFDFSPDEGLRHSNLAAIGADNLNWAFTGDYSSALAYVTSNAPFSKGSTLDKLRSFTSRITMAVHDGWGSSRQVDGYLDAIIQANLVSELEFFLHEMGIPEKLVVKEDSDGRKAIYCSHAKPLPFSRCMSSGTRTLVSIFYLYRVVAPGTLYLLDEFDAYCHFELAENLLRSLGSMAGAQTISTTHNTSLTRNDVMRPDCIFKFGKDGLLSALSERTSRELRFGNNVEKLLRNGEFD